MGRRTERLTLDRLAELPGGCATCLFWEHSPVSRARLRGHEAEEKAAWVSELLREWGSCGRVVVVDDVVAGHAIYAPPAYVPGAAGFATAPVGHDAVLLSTVYVDPAYRDAGLGRMLIQSMARDLLERGGIRAVEAFGDTRALPHGARETGCTMPVEFLLAVGFKTQRAHARYPRMRMDLRTTVTWREEFEGALEKFLVGIGVKAPAPKPAQSLPGHRTMRQGNPPPDAPR